MQGKNILSVLKKTRSVSLGCLPDLDTMLQSESLDSDNGEGDSSDGAFYTFSRVPHRRAVRARLLLIIPSLLSPLTERNAFYDLFRRHLRPEAIIPYQGRKLSARVVTTIGTTRRDYRHDSKVRNKKNQECHHDSLGFHFLTNLLSTIHYSF